MMNAFRFRWNGFELCHDRDYGIDHRSGWSVAINGSFVVQLHPSLFGALRKSWRLERAARREDREAC